MTLAGWGTLAEGDAKLPDILQDVHVSMVS